MISIALPVVALASLSASADGRPAPVIRFESRALPVAGGGEDVADARLARLVPGFVPLTGADPAASHPAVDGARR